jgi:hypothetical protein
MALLAGRETGYLAVWFGDPRWVVYGYVKRVGRLPVRP